MKMIEKYIKEQAAKLDFDFIRITKAEKLPRERIFFQNWLEKGCAGSMEYLKKDPEKRSDPEKILPGAKSIICLGLNYFQDAQAKHAESEFKIARYALGRDYHKVLKEKLKKFIVLLKEYTGKNTKQNTSL